jgi:arabinan endo-1,5-alpha-L-arabinosidase
LLILVLFQAPDVIKAGNMYHSYYSVSQFDSQNSAIGLATSSTMDPGSWTDQGSVGVSSNPTKSYNAIDTNMILANGNHYLNFGSFWGGIYQVQLNSAATQSSGSAYNIEYNSTGSRPSEGAFMFYNTGYYYLLWPSGICCGYDQYVIT